MTFLEFKTQAEELGFTVKINKDQQDIEDEQFNRVYVYLQNGKTSIDIAKILEFKTDVMWFLDGNNRSYKIADLIEEFNNTKVEDRNYDVVEMTEMDKAVKVINDDAIKATDIENKTSIGAVSISNYRTGKTDLNKVKWEIIHKLAGYYDERNKHND
ncbi:hypothetical protein LOOC260_110040 [Paucilactobacillus hokkaidonensis JCM 18461]|uniref:Uncharacterized protein n=2 Tax=Paucilactobacillus hokkaidonensis TaxID=1193095 RepID=A0A0A1GX75_9LACO|nr:hypothetical protein [Paucilactobacillus hokkaidonensis]KRO09790.1 hypothetical protein IV59_GL000403 [Paucilactobacillus hokkaidonensis]BAP85543.1 hypothetical protein LOOC260_110040 [Paucilactobacillus hokkaidonensis JCM 18461]